MTMHGVRLFPIGLVVLSGAVATGTLLNAQNKLPNAQPATAAPAAASTPAVAPAPPASDVAAVPAPVPEPPKHPADLPPKPPKVTCQGDQLTISADNSGLDAILAAVRGCTGAKIDMPGDAGRIRSFEQLGPGPARAILDQLLSGTPYNYVIESSEANPLKVEQVMLTARTEDSGKPAAVSTEIPMTPGRRAWQHMQKFDKPDPSTLNADGTQVEADVASPADEATAASAAPQSDANTKPAAANSGEAAPAEAAAAPTPQPAMTPVAPPIVDPNSSADPSKAMEGRIAQMQQLFNQRQQMMQKQNQSQGSAPNN